MATKRFGYLDDLSLKGQKVGIGTSTPTDKLEVIGGTRGGDVVVTGIATFASHGGILNRDTSYTGNIRIDSGESGTLSGEVVVGTGLTISVGTGATSGQGNIKSLKVSNTFTPPIGGINDRPSAPQPGALYYNKDFRTIEYWDGNFWRQVDNTTRSGRGVWGGGATPSWVATQDFITISTLGNAVHFGELTVGRAFFNSVGSSTRSVTGGGENGPRVDTMDYFTIQASGNAVDFGNLSAARTAVFSVSSSTRGVWGGGEESGGNVNTMEFIEISTTGNAVDFGDRIITTKQGNCGLVNSPTRGIFAGGPYWADDIDMITIAAKGNSISFGELSDHRKGFASCSNSSRGIFICGESKSGSNIDTLDYITIATQGNAIDFGNASSSRVYVSGVSNGTRGVWSGGATALNIIEYVNFATLGDAIDFGDLALGRRGAAGSSDSHGGLGGF